MKHLDHSSGCLICSLRRDLAGHVRCRSCGGWFPREDSPTHEAVIACPEAECQAAARAYHASLGQRRAA